MKILLSLMCIVIFSNTLSAQQKDQNPVFERVAERGWYEEQRREFRRYPHIDKVNAYIAQKQLQKAIEELHLLLQAIPDDDNARFSLIVLLVQENNYEAAENEVDILSRYYPNSFPVGVYKVEILIKLDKTKEAIVALETLQSLAVTPTDYINVVLKRIDLVKKDQSQDSQEIASLYEQAYALSSPKDPTLLFFVAQSYADSKSYEQAETYFKMFFQFPESQIKKNQTTALESYATVLEALEKYDMASDVLYKRIGLEKRPLKVFDLSMYLVEILQKNQENKQALTVLEDVNIPSNVPTNSLYRYYVLKMALYQKEEQKNQFEKTALIAMNNKQFSKKQQAFLAQQAGYASYGVGKKEQALRYFEQAQKLGIDTQTIKAQIAYTASGLKRYKVALRNLEQALSKTPFKEKQKRAEMYADLAQLYVKDNNPKKAVLAYEKSLKEKHINTVAVEYAFLLHQEGQIKQALEFWEKTETSKLSLKHRSQRDSEMALLYKKDGQAKKSLEIYDRLMQKHSPDLQDIKEYAALLRIEKQYAEAKKYALKAWQIKPDAGSRLELGYNNLSLGNYQEALSDFKAVLKQQPNEKEVYAQLGYTNKYLHQNQEASKWFKKTLDKMPENSDLSTVEGKKEYIEKFDIRRGIQDVDKQLNVTLAWGFSSGQTGRIEDAIISRSGSGIEISWTVPQISVIDGDSFQLIGRSMWSNPPDDLGYNNDTMQGAVGIRYKPFADKAFALGVERLIEIGKDTENAWLLRAMASAGATDMQPLESSWLYTFVFTEFDAFVGSTQDRTTVYGEGRLGWTWNINDTILITPHLVADARYWSKKIYASNWEVGGGLSLMSFNEATKYLTHQVQTELLLQYKVGQLFNVQNSNTKKNIKTLSVDRNSLFNVQNLNTKKNTHAFFAQLYVYF